MPMSRISLLKGKSPDYIRALADSLHAAMVEEFNVPEKDRFQVIHQHEPNELLFDRDYESDGGHRSDDFVLIAITAGRVRDTARKQAFYRRVVERLAESPGIDPRDVMVVITTTLGDEWSFSGGMPAAALMRGVAP